MMKNNFYTQFVKIRQKYKIQFKVVYVFFALLMQLLFLYYHGNPNKEPKIAMHVSIINNASIIAKRTN